MTRNEAIQVILNIRAPGNSDVGYRYSVGADVDEYAALGMLKLDEHQDSATAEEKLKEALTKSGYDPKTFGEVLKLIEWAGLRLVDKFPTERRKNQS